MRQLGEDGRDGGNLAPIMPYFDRRCGVGSASLAADHAGAVRSQAITFLVAGIPCMRIGSGQAGERLRPGMATNADRPAAARRIVGIAAGEQHDVGPADRPVLLLPGATRSA